MLTKITTVVLIFTWFPFTAGPIQPTNDGKSYIVDLYQDLESLAEESIQEIYPYPALVVEKEKIKRYRFTIPSDADTTNKDAPPYTAFVNRKYLCPEKNDPVETGYSPYDQFDSQDYCLAEKPVRDFSKPILCESEVRPLIVEIPRWKRWKDLGRNCGNRSTDKHYAYVYQECKTFKKINEKLQKYGTRHNEEIELMRNSINLIAYEFCYDTTNKETIYTYHTIRSPNLLYNKSLYRERGVDFSMKTYTYGLFGDDFQNIEEAYKNNKYSMTAQKLVPPNDMELGLLRKPAFHYVNTKAMHEKLVPIWEVFNKRIEELAFRDDIPLKIYTTTIGALESNGSKLFLADDRTTIPEIWCKLIIHKLEKKHKLKKDLRIARGIAFLLHNFADQNQPIRNPYCDRKICDVSKWKELLGDEIRALAGKYAYCCEVGEEISSLFPLLNLKKFHMETFTKITPGVF